VDGAQESPRASKAAGDAPARCPQHVAALTTERRSVNAHASFLTWNLYTLIHS
jgi:hypothetical protein